MFTVKVEGSAIVGTKIKDIKPYEETFNMEEGREPYARSIIQKSMINERLRKKMTNFRSVRTCQIVSIEESDAKPDKDNGELETLVSRAVELSCVPPTLDNYSDPKSKIKLLKSSITRRENKLKKLAEKEKDSNVIDEGYVD